jgi:hypothetical protein
MVSNRGYFSLAIECRSRYYDHGAQLDNYLSVSNAFVGDNALSFIHMVIFQPISMQEQCEMLNQHYRWCDCDCDLDLVFSRLDLKYHCINLHIRSLLLYL